MTEAIHDPNLMVTPDLYGDITAAGGDALRQNPLFPVEPMPLTVDQGQPKVEATNPLGLEP